MTAHQQSVMKRVLFCPLTLSSKRFLVFLLCVSLIYLGLYNYDISLPDKYTGFAVGDWLINYAGGFVRRGLSGSLLIPLAHMFGIRPEISVMLVKIFLYSVIYIGMALFIMRCQSLRVVDAFIIFSPAYLLFPILGTVGGGRKEILLLAWVTYQLLQAQRGRKLPSDALISVLFFLLTFLHEGIVFFLPLAYIVVHRIYDVAVNANKAIITLAPSLFYVILLLLLPHTSDEAMIRAIAQAIDPVNYTQWINGAILELTHSFRHGVDWVKGGITSWTFFSIAIAVVLFAFPFLTLDKSEYFFRLLPQDKWMLIAAFMLQLPIFLIAVDWGRWLYIDASLLSMYYLSTHTTSAPNIVMILKDNAIKFSQLAILILCLTLHITSWQLKSCCTIGAIAGITPIILHKALIHQETQK